MLTFVELFQIVLSIDPALNPDDLRILMAHLTPIEVSDHRAYGFFSVLASTYSICTGGGWQEQSESRSASKLLVHVLSWVKVINGT